MSHPHLHWRIQYYFNDHIWFNYKAYKFNDHLNRVNVYVFAGTTERNLRHSCYLINESPPAKQENKKTLHLATGRQDKVSKNSSNTGNKYMIVLIVVSGHSIFSRGCWTLHRWRESTDTCLGVFFLDKRFRHECINFLNICLIKMKNVRHMSVYALKVICRKRVDQASIMSEYLVRNSRLLSTLPIRAPNKSLFRVSIIFSMAFLKSASSLSVNFS